MMKIFIPRNVSKGLFNMSIQMGPLSVSVFQLVLLAIGLGIGLGIWNTLIRSNVGKITASIIALPVIILFIIIAFFRFSELTLVPFIAKMIRTNFLDVTKKYQINRQKPDPKVIALAKSRKTDQETVIENKVLIIDHEKMDRLNRVID